MKVNTPNIFSYFKYKSSSNNANTLNNTKSYADASMASHRSNMTLQLSGCTFSLKSKFCALLIVLAVLSPLSYILT